MKVTVEMIKGRDAKPGDLFTTSDQKYWDKVLSEKNTLGERVYLRTNRPCPPEQADVDVYRLKIDKDEGEGDAEERRDT